MGRRASARRSLRGGLCGAGDDLRSRCIHAPELEWLATRRGRTRLPRQHAGQLAQRTLDLEDPLARVTPQQLAKPGELALPRRDRELLCDLPPGTRQRQPLDEQQVLEPQNALDIRPAVDPRAALQDRSTYA